MAQVESLIQPSMATNGSLKFTNLLPKETKDLKFFSYMGSLTTPACEEIVKWTVIADIMPIKDDQVEKQG